MTKLMYIPTFEDLKKASHVIFCVMLVIFCLLLVWAEFRSPELLRATYSAPEKKYYKVPKIGFPVSPIMPHQNVIDGVSPYGGTTSANLDSAVDALSSVTKNGYLGPFHKPGDFLPNSDPGSFTEPIFSTPKDDVPGAGLRLPSFASVAAESKDHAGMVSLKPNFNYNRESDPYYGYEDQLMKPRLFNIPVDAEMTPWTEWDSCNSLGYQERRRTCLSQEQAGGVPCQHTFERRKCVK